jgi:hypothetical protein
MFRPDILTIFRESSMTYAAYVSTYRLEFSEVIKLLLCLQFLKSKLFLDRVKIQLNT